MLCTHAFLFIFIFIKMVRVVFAQVARPHFILLQDKIKLIDFICRKIPQNSLVQENNQTS